MTSLGLIGFPLEHSLSPCIQQAALDYAHLKGNYDLFPIAPDDMDGLRVLLERVHSGEITGLNVTIPHKQNVIPLLDALTPRHRPLARSTQLSAKMASCWEPTRTRPAFWPTWKRPFRSGPGNESSESTLWCWGAGGAARAVVYALLSDAWQGYAGCPAY